MIKILSWIIIIMKLKFINSSRNEREKDENIVKMIVTEMMIFELKKLLIDAETFLILMNKMIIKMKWD